MSSATLRLAQTVSRPVGWSGFRPARAALTGYLEWLGLANTTGFVALIKSMIPHQVNLRTERVEPEKYRTVEDIAAELRAGGYTDEKIAFLLSDLRPKNQVIDIEGGAVNGGPKVEQPAAAPKQGDVGGRRPSERMTKVMSDVDINIEEFGAGADIAAALVDPTIAPEPELDVGPERVSLSVKLLAAEAREHFWAFRKFIHPELIEGWWQVDVAEHLDQFYRDYVAGKRPKLVLTSPPQHGKPLSDQTLTLTTTGWKRHGDLKVDDRVFHPSGWTTRVVAVSEKAAANYRVELTNGEVFYCHGRHEWTVHNRYNGWTRKTPQTLETCEMLERSLVIGTPGKRGCRYMFQLPFVEPLLGEEKKLPANPYMLGVWLGDGSSTIPAITYGERDACIVGAVTACGFSPGNTEEVPKDSGVFRTYFYNPMLNQLRAAGVLAEQFGIRTKHIPDVYLTASLRQRLNCWLALSIPMAPLIVRTVA